MIYTVKVKNRSKGLDLVNMVPEELWTKVPNIVQEAVTKAIPKKKKWKTAKWLCEEALPTAEEKEEKGKIYPSECRVPEKSKEKQENLLKWMMQKIRENKRMGKTRDLFKKAGDTKGKSHAKMVTIKGRNGKEAEEIKKSWKEYTGGLYKGVNDLDNHQAVVTHLEPDILECEVKWALQSISKNKASGGDGIPDELFQILKDDAVKVLHSICQQIWKTQHWPKDWKRSVFIPIPK